jgi:hypothetical protein
MSRLSRENAGALTSHNFVGLNGLSQGYFYLFTVPQSLVPSYTIHPDILLTYVLSNTLKLWERNFNDNEMRNAIKVRYGLIFLSTEMKKKNILNRMIENIPIIESFLNLTMNVIHIFHRCRQGFKFYHIFGWYTLLLCYNFVISLQRTRFCFWTSLHS